MGKVYLPRPFDFHQRPRVIPGRGGTRRKMIQKGTMRPLKKIMGVTIGLAGLGLVVMPEKITPLLCDNKIAFGVLLAAAGYFLAFSGRQL